MLTMTPEAGDAVRLITGQVSGAEDAGVRILAGGDHDSDFTLAVANAPDPGDQVVEDHGARLFLEEPVAQLLDESVLDARVQDDGAVRFAIGNRA